MGQNPIPLKIRILCLLLSVGWVSALNAQISNAFLDSLASYQTQESGVPGMAIGVVKTDQTYFGIGGSSKIDEKVPVTLNSKFHLGSNTKAIISFITFKHIENGVISLDTKFFEVLPELKDSSRSEYHEITLSDLLSHNAGIRPYTSGLEYLEVPKLEGNTTEQRRGFAKFVLKKEPVHKGTYSNAGYALAALMLETQTGKSLEELIESNMKEIEADYFIGFPNKEVASNPWGHWEENGELKALAPDHFYKLTDYMLPAGDLSMNIKDYCTYLQLHLKGLNGTDNYLKATSYQSIHYGLKGYSYGWGNTIKNGESISYHDGSTGTYYCHAMVFPKDGLAIVIFINSASDKHVKGVYQLREKLYSMVKTQP